MELEADFHELCREARGLPPVERGAEQKWHAPDFSLCLTALPGAHWSALLPDAPLRRWRLIEMGAHETVVFSPLRIDERVLHSLTGVNVLDSRLQRLVDYIPSSRPSTDTEARTVKAILGSLRQASAASSRLPIIQLCGTEPPAKRAAAAAACADAGWTLFSLMAESLPTSPVELETFRILWEREALLSDAALLIDADLLDLDAGESTRGEALTQLLERLDAPIFLCVPDRRRPLHRPVATFDVPRPTIAEQRSLWQAALGAKPKSEETKAESASIEIAHLASQFDLGAGAIRDAAHAALAESAGDPDRLWSAAWEACRVQARPRLDDLAQRIESRTGWDDLVLPSTTRQILEVILAQVRQRETVYERWGMGGKGARGLGITALFAGGSGTGKTTAAEVLAAELNLDLYRVDLSATVSKYIGETEKNLRRVFDAAESGGVVLLFDEADALFGKRSDVKDSHDRHANVEVSYLLQRMESYRGLAILTTNLRAALDTAFLRRIRFVIQFPFQDAALRAELWRRAFPKTVPTEGLDPLKLAQLNIAGGNIRNIALNAAFLAANAGEPIHMSHILIAAQAEYSKLDRSLTEAETAGWTD